MNCAPYPFRKSLLASFRCCRHCFQVAVSPVECGPALGSNDTVGERSRHRLGDGSDLGNAHKLLPFEFDNAFLEFVCNDER